MIGNEPWGSSPRVRGSRLSWEGNNTKQGIIPAGAGLTFTPPRCATGPGDHPRGCGAHDHPLSHVPCRGGSSPRVRGSHWYAEKHPSPIGIIPAGAGLTHCYRHVHCRIRDHPRGCGAHSFSYWLQLVMMGSSPRVRGSPLGVVTSAALVGIIPAGAGLTASTRSWPGPSRDHPRGCGAHQMAGNNHQRLLGSSPRVRGSLWLHSFIESN